MRLYSNIIMLTLLLTLLLLPSCLQTSLSLYTSQKMTPFQPTPEWPADLQENIKKVSLKPFCLEEEKCRQYSQVKNVAQCKANKIAKLLPENYQFFYVMTQLKSLNEEEYTKFVFAYKSKV